MDNYEKSSAEVEKEAGLHTSVQVRLAKDDIFFGPGKARLMEYIEKTGSMQEACLEALQQTFGSTFIYQVAFSGYIVQ